MIDNPPSQRDWLGSAGLTALSAAAFFLPFELKQPLLNLGLVSVSSAEVGIYLTILIWGMGWLLGCWRTWTKIHSAVAAWAMAVLLSGLLSRDYHAEAMKFSLRSLGGCALFFAAADILRIESAVTACSYAIIAGSVASALCALAEMWLPGAARLLMIFKTQPSFDGSYLRASGTFQYANIASMYWEATLPLALLLPQIQSRGRLAGRWVALALGTSTVLLAAIVLSYCRAGILIAGLELIIVILAGFKVSEKSLRFSGSVSLLSLCALVCVYALSDDIFRLRLTTPDSSDWYRAELHGLPEELTMEVGQAMKIPIMVRNAGLVGWRTKGPHSAALSYHWLNPESKAVVIWQGARSELQTNVEPGHTVKIDAWIIAPATTGNYLLQWDMLQETAAWFTVVSPGNTLTKVRILPATSSRSITNASPPSPVAPSPVQPRRLDLWRAALRMWISRPIVGVGPDNFRHLRGRFLKVEDFDDRIHSNNLYLETLATLGLAGALALAAVLIGLTVQLRMARVQCSRSAQRIVLLALGLSLMAFVLHGFVDYFLPFTPTYALFWLLAGMVVGSRPREQNR